MGVSVFCVLLIYFTLLCPRLSRISFRHFFKFTKLWMLDFIRQILIGPLLIKCQLNLISWLEIHGMEEQLPNWDEPDAVRLQASEPDISEELETLEDAGIKIETDEDDGIDVLSFPVSDLARLDEMISSPRWVVPVLPGGQLEVLLDASIQLCRKGKDIDSEPCQRFFRDGLTTSFTKILTDEAVSSWKPEIHKCILRNSERLLELIVVKLDQDWFPLLELLSIVLNPSNKFHSYNANRPPESYSLETPMADDELYARPIDNRLFKGWLVDLINRFGGLGGFKILSERFTSAAPISVTLVYALLKPFGLCWEFLTRHTIEKYFTPVFTAVPQILENLTDDDLKKETTKSDIISSIIKCLKSLHSRISDSEELIRSLELFRLRMILRMLQVSSFNGKMNALNEINQVIQNVQTHYPHHYHHSGEDPEYLTSKRIAEWIQENQVLQIVLRDSLHQPQYVEKLEKILRFIIKEKTLTLKDLDDIWAAQMGKHDAIVKNLHDLLAKLAWDFSPEQLDHLFECFQASWTTANKRQREKLLELIRRLAEDDKDGVMAHKVLSLFWNLAHSNEVPTEIMDQALSAHVKVLDYSCSQRESQKMTWLSMSMTHLMQSDVDWVIPAMKHMKEIFSLYQDSQTNPKTVTVNYRVGIIARLQKEKQIVLIVTARLNTYMEKVRAFVKEKGSCDPFQVKLDGRYSHVDQIKERLTFLRFLLKEGQMYLAEEQANLVWQCLAEDPVFPIDREICFEWFSKLMGDKPYLEPAFFQPFFERKVLNFDATQMTESGMDCFERFFKAVNVYQKKLFIKRDDMMMDDLDMIGMDYIWKLILSGSEDMAARAISFLQKMCTALGPKLLPQQREVHDDFLSSCCDRLKTSYDTILVLEKDKDSTNRVRQEVTRACRVLRVLLEYIMECDSEYGEERAFIPMYRAFRGRNMTIFVRFPSVGSRGFDDVEIFTHTSESLAGLRRQIIRKFKTMYPMSTSFKMELFFSNEIITLNDDRTTLASWGIRDKLLFLAKIHNNATNSPDSSEESSGGTPNHYTNCSDGPNIEAEETLPSVMMSMDEKRMEFLCLLCGLGSTLGEDRLRDAARNLLSIIPPCRNTESVVRTAFLQHTDRKPYNILFNREPATDLYRLEVLYSMLFPAVHWDDPNTVQLLTMFFVTGGAGAVVEMLTKNNFMPLADVATKRLAYLTVLKLTKAVLTVTAHLLMLSETEWNHIGEDRLRVLSDAIQSVPHASHEFVLRTLSANVSNSLFNIIKESEGKPDAVRVLTECLRQLLSSAVDSTLPDIDTIRLIIRLAGATASGSFSYFSAEQHQANREPSDDDIQVCEEALEVLTLSFLLNPAALESIVSENTWKNFLRTVLFHSLSGRIRYTAHDQFFTIATKATGNPKVLHFFIQFLFEIMQTSIQEIPQQARDVCHLLCNLLRYAINYQIPIPNHEQMLNTQLEWLRHAKELTLANGEGAVQDDLLEGNIVVATELVCYLSPEKKHLFGCGGSNGEPSLITEIVEEFIFPWSKAYYNLKKSGEINFEQPIPVCSSPIAVNAILDLLVSMCSDCYPNLKLVVESLSKLFNYSPDGDGTTTDWEFLPAMGSRPMGGFVGLKNAGATCYMNSVIQQLYMVDNIKRGVLSVASTDPDADEGIEDSGDTISRCQSENNIQDCTSSSPGGDDRKNYNITILKQVQSIFGHLALSKTQYFVPTGLWKHFRLQGEAVNLREQQDAVEFFMSLIESVDEGLKALGQEQVMSRNLGGLFSDQKICKECPHRYSKEEPFSVISVDIRNHSNLLDSLEQYVKGELLEGADAYHCEPCNKKVVTVKRLCVKKLPSVLAIQLKRFEYDYERDCATKFNDYFEFPRDLDMEPYTVSALAKIEGEIIDDDARLLAQNVPTSYRLTGIVVHSGQASGGHYYSYISFKCNDGIWRWFKFDDGDVSECRMDDDEELKNQCFGGDYSGEVFDHMIKRMSFRRQKRWWNAYILFYTQNEVADIQGVLSTKVGGITLHEKRLQMSSGIEKVVLRQNIDFMHSKSQYSQEYFQFVRKLVGRNLYTVSNAFNAHKEGIWTNVPESVANEEEGLPEEIENLALMSIQMATMFLFSVGFRTKKGLRGSANDWFDSIGPYLKVSKKVRFWFATNALFRYPARIGEYLLECPSGEVRATFCKILVHLAHYSKNDGFYTPSVPMATLSRSVDKNAHLYEYILEAVINLLRRDVSEFGRHLAQYFTFFLNYASFGDEEKRHLLRFNVPSTFISLALEDGALPPIKYQCADLSKLYQIVSILIRSCDVSHRCRSSIPDEAPLLNPFCETSGSYPLQKLPDNISSVVYGRGHIKKVLEEASGTEETLQLLQFLCWENSSFSNTVLSEILGHIGYSYSTELKTFLEVLTNVIRINDSWYLARIEQALRGIPGEKDGLIEIIHRNKQNQHKRAYLFMKCVTNLMEPNSAAHHIITQSPELQQKWNLAVEWLERELDRRAPPTCTAYGYSTTTWSPPSNEAANGSFFLERSHSAKLTLDRALLLRVYSNETASGEAEDEISSEGEREDECWEEGRPDRMESNYRGKFGWEETMPTSQSSLKMADTMYGPTGTFIPSVGTDVEWVVDDAPQLEPTTIEGGNGGSGSGPFPFVMEQTIPLKSSSSPEESHVNSPAPLNTPQPPVEDMDTVDFRPVTFDSRPNWSKTPDKRRGGFGN